MRQTLNQVNLSPNVTIGGYYGNSNQGIQTLTTSQLSSLDSTFFSNSIYAGGNVKRYEIYEFSEDVLALSVTWKRLRDASQSPKLIPITRLTDNELFIKITSDDNLMAEKIADYYSKKIMMLKLSDSSELSSYRKDLNEFIHSDRKKVVDKMFGLAYYLPSFYEYDNDLDSIRNDLVIKQDWSKKHIQQHGKQQSLVLTPMKRLHRKTNKLNNYQYWLKTTDGTGVVISLEPKNTLLKIWEHFFNKNEQIVISGTTFCKTLDGFEYLSIKNWEIVHG